VAYLVSSLQQYEDRKPDREPRRYITFSPVNLKTVTSNLHLGLTALNQRDNQTAAECFAAAVFSFDDFYAEVGLDKLVN